MPVQEVTFSPSSSDTRCIGVVIIDDLDFEETQTVTIQFGNLSTSESLVTALPSNFVIFIEDNNGIVICIMIITLLQCFSVQMRG